MRTSTSSSIPSSNLSPSFLRLALLLGLVVLTLTFGAASGQWQQHMAMHKPGAPREVDGAANSLDLQQTAQFAVEQHNKKQNSALKLLKVVTASKQVVAGTLTKIKLWAADEGAGTAAEYEASVWEKPWENFKDTTEFKMISDGPRPLTDEESAAVKACKVITVAGATAHAAESGTGRPVSVADPAVQQAAESAVSALQKRSNSLLPYQLKAIQSAALQSDVDKDGPSVFHLVLELVRGDAAETKKLIVQLSGDGHWLLK